MTRPTSDLAIEGEARLRPAARQRVRGAHGDGLDKPGIRACRGSSLAAGRSAGKRAALPRDGRGYPMG
jgi:hypothetical protein